jgi:hypothetical protein
MWLTDDATLYFNNNLSTATVFWDIGKDFATTWHLGLLYKLSTLKFSISLINPFSSFSEKIRRLGRRWNIYCKAYASRGAISFRLLPHIVQYTVYKWYAPKHLVSIWVSLLVKPVCMRQTTKRVIFSESCNEVSMLLILGVSHVT